MDSQRLAIRLCKTIPTWFPAPADWQLTDASRLSDLLHAIRMEAAGIPETLILLWIPEGNSDDSLLFAALDSTSSGGIPRSVVTDDATLAQCGEAFLNELFSQRFCIEGDQMIVVLTDVSDDPNGGVISSLISAAAKTGFAGILALPQAEGLPINHQALWSEAVNKTGNTIYLYSASEGLYPSELLSFLD